MATTKVALEPNTPTAALSAKLRVNKVNMTFNRDGQRLSVLDNIDLEVADGEFVCILGPSGCGKSTLLSAIAGFLTPTSGQITIGGEAVRGPDPRRIFVFQERGVFPWLTVAGNIGFGLAKLKRAERTERVQRYIQMVGL